MFKYSNKHLLLLLSIFIFAFIYRILLMTRATYPSGADIGLHNSVIYSITSSGNTNFLWNFYQMGGGLSLTFPGYHIFVSYIMLLTGMPDYLVHSIVVSLFSSVIVLCSYLITRAVWRESAALVVAFLVAISRFDVEMLLWGGYPNVITLLLIPLTFYLFLQRERFSLAPFLISTSILCGSIFFTHSLSSGVFISITLVMVLLGLIFSKKIGTTRLKALSWLLPLFIGAIIVSPFLIAAVPAYLNANPDVVDIEQALVSTRILPLEIILPLFACVILFFLLSKKYQKRFFTFPTLLLVMWILVPVIFTQGYLVGFYIDYNRFLYFVILPVFILIGLAIDHGSGFFARIIDTYRTLTSQLNGNQKIKHKKLAKLNSYINRKNIYSIFIIGFLLFAFLAIPIFVTPAKGIDVQKFYQVMNAPRYEAMQWAKQNTATGSVFVSDAYYGWWFSGFAQRPTLSAVDPQYLTLARELEPAQVAKNLLDTDYMVDNGFIQVREDGGYLARHNPMFLAKLNWTYFPYPFLQFNNSLTTIKYRVSNDSQTYNLDQLAVKEMRIENDTQHATIIVKKGNDFINYTQLTTIYSGTPFVNMSITVESTVAGVSLEWVQFLVNSKGTLLEKPKNNTIALLDEGVKAFGQLIFTKQQPEFTLYNPVNPCLFNLEYDLQDKSKEEIQLSVGVFSVTDNLDVYQNQQTKERYFDPIISSNVNSLPRNLNSSIEELFDYQTAINSNSISYIACRDSELKMKFANDPAFNLVFINDDVAIFKVKKQL